MMRFCPSCQTERSLLESSCEGPSQVGTCGWDLLSEQIHAPGWRPQPVVTRDTPASGLCAVAGGDLPRCVNGHAMHPGDLLCLECSGEPATSLPSTHQAGTPPDDTAHHGETQIDGWRTLREISRTDSTLR